MTVTRILSLISLQKYIFLKINMEPKKQPVEKVKNDFQTSIWVYLDVMTMGKCRPHGDPKRYASLFGKAPPMRFWALPKAWYKDPELSSDSGSVKGQIQEKAGFGA